MPIRPEQFAILKRHLETLYVPHLPPLIQPKGPVDDLKKNIDRAFAAFAVDHLCRANPKRAAQSVIDDFDDYGIDAIYYDLRTKTLYLVQAKLKETSAFTQPEALAFVQGVRKLLNDDFSGFNSNVVKREAQIRLALNHCSRIELVVAHTGVGILVHAGKALGELLADKAGGDSRLQDQVLDFDAARTVRSLHSVNAVEPVNCRIRLDNYGQAEHPKVAFYGGVALSALADLHLKHGKALYQKNIRTWLGHDTPVNVAIRQTLADNPARFQYLNNGVTALCETIEPKGGKGTEYREFELTGFSIINGAQTVASSANYVVEHADADISEARVMITLIKADAESEFGKDVTRARNYQNDVKAIAFAALDEEQERIRRELDHLEIEYVYRVGEEPSGAHANRILVAEALQALAMLELDPRYPVWMKRSLVEFQKADGEPYGQIFSQSLSSIKLANAVRVYRQLRRQIAASIRGSAYDERRTYKHGEYILGFVLAKRFREAIDGVELIDLAKLAAAVSAPYDELRQSLWDIVQATMPPGPLSLSKNQDSVQQIIRQLMTQHYQLTGDAALGPLRAKSTLGQPYPLDLFKYLDAKAPQIKGVT